MATIEPRLIHLLNEPAQASPQPPPVDLPPLQTLTLPPASSDRLLPLEPNASHGPDSSRSNSHLPESPAAPPYAVLDGPSSSARSEAAYATDHSVVNTTKTYPLRMLLEGMDLAHTGHSFGGIGDDQHDGNDDLSTKKRHRLVTVKDDFVQLPQPVKKQKASKRLHMPPIINGLHEPPPHAAIFPPIVENNNDPSNKLVPLREPTNVSDQRGKAGAKGSRKKAAKPRRKWTDQETDNLLLGVSRHGVGKWTSILEDPDFKFVDRTAGDLKDRFRTCCPADMELGGYGADRERSPRRTPSGEKTKAKTGLLSENILIETDELFQQEKTPTPSHHDSDSASAPSRKKPRAHRKKMEDLAKLGILEPFKKSRRRVRRPFTEQDDRQILEGLDLYGPLWTKIQRDPRFNLSHRQPTDLRDRVRNKYPLIYQRMEKNMTEKLLEPSVNMTIDIPLGGNAKREPQLGEPSLREEMPRFPLSVMDCNDGQTPPAAGLGFDFGDALPAGIVGGPGEMDISRLLLDDSHVGRTTKRFAAGSSGPDTPEPDGSSLQRLRRTNVPSKGDGEVGAR